MRRIAILLLLLVGSLYSASTNADESLDPTDAIRSQCSGIISALATSELAPLVDVRLPGNRADRAILHLCDWHFISPELFAKDVPSRNDKKLSEEQIEAAYESFLEEVEQVQSQQKLLLRRLIQECGIRRVWCEGLLPEDMLIYKTKIRLLAKWSKAERALRSELNSGKASDGREAEIRGILTALRMERLRVGAAGQLRAAGELEEVLPLEDAAAYQANRPFQRNQTDVDIERTMRRREDAQVANATGRPEIAVIILGGGHDLTDNVERRWHTRCRYITVSTPAYLRCSE